ncbi:MAG: hypothetical protein OMM_09741 [Candidatus Magnetoglobus multicellularis str. Araruama]|uniref:Uncharacterized protein n=1 Tax=Candidatus Magnetoglobus multicellularis str. Araruama TaxID=890399 RepID=A0A1V1P353_9BACT|nr:MAG: hypothetical protein OMM_09741 [Candidatus Magnetoglobus multicellularis str. Araruama]
MNYAKPHNQLPVLVLLKNQIIIQFLIQLERAIKADKFYLIDNSSGYYESICGIFMMIWKLTCQHCNVFIDWQSIYF